MGTRQVIWPEWSSVSTLVTRHLLLGSTQKAERMCWDAIEESELPPLRDRNEE